MGIKKGCSITKRFDQNDNVYNFPHLKKMKIYRVIALLKTEGKGKIGEEARQL